MIGCYILFSVRLQKFYIGATQEDVSIWKENAQLIETILFTETPTLGIRKYKVDRNELQRPNENILVLLMVKSIVIAS